MTTLVDGMVSRARALAHGLRAATARQRALAAFVAGALSVLAMAPFFLSPILLLTFPVLVWLIDVTAAAPEAVNDAPLTPNASRAVVGGKRAGWLAVKQSALVGWLFGFGYFLFGMFWIGEAFLVEAEKFAWLLPVAVTLLPAGLALFFGVAAAIAHLLWRPGFSRVLVLATSLALAEGLRGHVLTGLPWNTLGYALTWPLILMQSAGLLGIYGLTILAVIIFGGPLVALADSPVEAAPPMAERTGAGASRPSLWHALTGIALSVILVACLWGYGVWRLSGDSGARVANVKLRIVQPSVPQREKWQPDKQREIFDLHVDLSRRSPAGVRDDLRGISHVIWPEAAMPFLPLETPTALKEIGELLPENVHLISGALRVELADGGHGNGVIPRTTAEWAQAPADAARVPQSHHEQHRNELSARRAYNSLMVFGPTGGLVAMYDKIHLVPFGEYLPFQAFLESIGLEQLTRIRGGFSVGRTPRPLLDVPSLPPFIGLVCYEAIFPGAVVQGPDRPSLIINVTNDGWFGNTTGPRQHFHMARVRAVEEGLPFVRVANNGISAVMDGYGRIVGRIDLDQRGVFDSILPVAAPPPLYVWSGERIYILYILATLAWFAGSSYTSRPRG